MTGQRALPETEPVAVNDKVRDVMLFTVPGLDYEEDLVDPDVPMRDDGAEGRFAKAYIHDEIPWMDLTNEVRDLMRLAVPSIDVSEEDLSFVDADVPEDGMEACWAVPAAEGADDTIAYSIPEYTTAICAPSEERAMIAAAGEVGLLPMPAPVPFEEILDGVVRDVVSKVVDQVLAEPISEPEPSFEEILDGVVRDVVSKVVDQVLAEPIPQTGELTMNVQAAPEIPMIPAATVMASLPEPIVAEEHAEENHAVVDPEPVEVDPVESADGMPAVRFSFGSQEVRGSGWRVCFSF